VQGKILGMEDPFIKPWMIDFADAHYELDISKARKLIGWEPKHRLIDTLPRMIEALKADPQGWYQHHKIEPPREQRSAG
jgi:nucleoside-diphosphate-sugar epimerase